MASEAQVDLIISTAGALPELERDLQRIVDAAEASADDVTIEAVLDRQASIAQLIDDVTDAVSAVNTFVPEIEVQAALDTLETLQNLHDDLDDVVDAAQAAARQIELDVALDADIAELEAEITAITEELEALAPEVDIDVDVDRDGRARDEVNLLTKAFKALVGPVSKGAKAIGGAGLAVGAAVPLVVGLTAAVQQLAPAAALLAPSLLTVALATNTVKVAMIGVGDAVKAAFDPGTKPEELAKALKNLAPEARAFVVELSSMRKGLKDIQLQVQGNFFKGFDSALKILGDRTLPIFGRAAQNTALILNQMAHNVAGAALELGNNGTLGNALSSANLALNNLVKVPGQVTTAFGQLAAAAGPSFERITLAASKAATAISEKLSASFASGGLESAIDRAVSALAQFGRSVRNIFEGLGNIFDTVAQSGGGLFATLEKVTRAFADVTATKGFQDALKAVNSLFSQLASTLLPLVSTALQALGPVFQALGPPLELLVKALGDALTPVIQVLSPVLVSLALAFGRLVGVVSPFIELAGDLVAALLPALVPLFDALGQVLNDLIPFAKQVAKILSDQLVPVFTTLAMEVLPQILPPMAELATKLLPVLTEVLVKLGPSIVALGKSFGDVLVALTPLIVELTNLALKLVEDLLPVIQPIIDVLIKLIELGLKALVFQIANIVVPAIQVLVDLLKGDFRGAWEGAKDIVSNVTEKISDLVAGMKERVADEFRQLGDRIFAKLSEIKAKLAQGWQEIVDKARDVAHQIPEVFEQALAAAGNILFQAGRDIVQGLINGLTSKLNELKDIASRIGSAVRDGVEGFLDIGSPSKVMMRTGHDTMDGFLIGLQDMIPNVRRELQGIAALAPSFALPNGQTLSLPQAAPGAPVVQVFLGNELLNGHVDARISQSNQSRDLLATRGTRR